MMKTKRLTIKLTQPWNGNQKGGVIDLTEPVAETLCAKGIAEPVGWKLSRQGTKTVSAAKVTIKG